MTYRLVRQLQQKAYSVAHVCRLLGISRSGFYEANKRAQAPAPICPITVQLKASYSESGGCYGSRPLRKRELQSVAGTKWHAAKHESQRKLLGQLRDGTFLPEPENGTCMAP